MRQLKRHAKHVPFTEEDDLFIQENFMNMKMKDLAKALNRSVGCISGRMNRMKLRKHEIIEKVENRIGTIVRPQPGILIHYGIFPNDYRGSHHKQEKE